MAKKKSSKRVNKSAAIKAYLAEHSTAGNTEVAAALKAQGVDVTPSYVSNVKTSQKKQGGKRRRRKTKRSPRETTPVQDVRHAGDLLFQAVDLVMKAGLKEAKAMVEVAGRMVERIKDKK